MTAEAGGEQAEVLGLLDSAPDGVLVVDAEGMVVWANRAAHEVFSPRGGSLVRRRWRGAKRRGPRRHQGEEHHLHIRRGS